MMCIAITSSVAILIITNCEVFDTMSFISLLVLVALAVFIALTPVLLIVAFLDYVSNKLRVRCTHYKLQPMSRRFR